MEQQIKAALFDFDGVVVDTEPLYDKLWNELGDRFEVGLKNFASYIKGTTMPYIIDTYFADRSDEFKQNLIQIEKDFESDMPFPPVPGALEFIQELKSKGVKVGLVTSSEDFKLARALRELKLEDTFDTIVSSDRITRGKPDPMCYMLAAEDLHLTPDDCIVFEDSFMGIKSATNAKMRVIGLSTTNPVDKLRPLTYDVIPNFEGIDFEKYLSWH